MDLQFDIHSSPLDQLESARVPMSTLDWRATMYCPHPKRCWKRTGSKYWLKINISLNSGGQSQSIHLVSVLSPSVCGVVMAYWCGFFWYRCIRCLFSSRTTILREIACRLHQQHCMRCVRQIETTRLLCLGYIPFVQQFLLSTDIPSWASQSFEK